MPPPTELGIKPNELSLKDQAMVAPSTPSDDLEAEKLDPVEQYFSNGLFWQNINKQATFRDENGELSEKEPLLFRNINILKDSSELRSVLAECDKICQRLAESYPDDPTVKAYMEEIYGKPDALWQFRDAALKFTRESVLAHIGMPSVVYHVSGIDASDFKAEDVQRYRLDSSVSGAMDPGVYGASYIDISYAGGDTKQAQVETPVVFSFVPDNQCYAYSVAHSKQPFRPIEITTKYRDCANFIDAEMVDFNNDELPICGRSTFEEGNYKGLLLVSGGEVVPRKIDD